MLKSLFLSANTLAFTTYIYRTNLSPEAHYVGIINDGDICSTKEDNATTITDSGSFFSYDTSSCGLSLNSSLISSTFDSHFGHLDYLGFQLYPDPECNFTRVEYENLDNDNVFNGQDAIYAIGAFSANDCSTCTSYDEEGSCESRYISVSSSKAEIIYFTGGQCSGPQKSSTEIELQVFEPKSCAWIPFCNAYGRAFRNQIKFCSSCQSNSSQQYNESYSLYLSSSAIETRSSTSRFPSFDPSPTIVEPTTATTTSTATTTEAVPSLFSQAPQELLNLDSSISGSHFTNLTEAWDSVQSTFGEVSSTSTSQLPRLNGMGISYDPSLPSCTGHSTGCLQLSKTENKPTPASLSIVAAGQLKNTSSMLNSGSVVFLVIKGHLHDLKSAFGESINASSKQKVEKSDEDPKIPLLLPKTMIMTVRFKYRVH